MSLERVIIYLLDNSISAMWVVMAVIILRLLLSKAPKRIVRILWALPALRLALPFSIESVVSLVPGKSAVPQEILTAPVPRISSNLTAVDAVVNPVLEMSFTPSPGASVNPMQIIMYICGIVWLSGLVIMLLIALISTLRLRRRLYDAVHESGKLWRSDSVRSPFILGIVSPRIIIPYSLDGEALKMVLAHEQCHLKSGDHILKLLGYLMLSVYWFNPFIWLGYILFCRDTELSCDEKVIATLELREKKIYSLALLDSADKRHGSVLSPLAFGEVGVKERIKKVLSFKKPAVWITVSAIVIVLAASVCLLTDPIEKEAVNKGNPAPFMVNSLAANLTLDFDRADEVYSLEVQARCVDEYGNYRSYSGGCQHGDGTAYAVNEQIYLEPTEGIGGSSSITVHARDINGRLIGTSSFYWKEIEQGGGFDYKWSEGDFVAEYKKNGAPGVFAAISSSCPHEVFALEISAANEPINIGSYRRNDGTALVPGEAVHIAQLDGLSGKTDFIISAKDKSGAELGSQFVSLELNGSERIELYCSMRVHAHNNAEEPKGSDLICESVNKELKSLFDLGILSNEIVLNEAELSVFEMADRPEPDAIYPQLEGARLFQIQGSSQDSKRSVTADFDTMTGRIVNLSVSSKKTEDVFPAEVTLDEFCKALNEYWGFGGYTIADTDWEHGHLDTPSGSEKLAELDFGNTYLTVLFDGKQAVETIHITLISSPDFSVIMFGMPGHPDG